MGGWIDGVVILCFGLPWLSRAEYSTVPIGIDM